VAFGAKSSLTELLLALASILGLVQLVGSIWSLTYRWDDDFAYAMESMSANRSFYEKFKSLADDLPSSPEEANYRFELLQAESNARSDADVKQHATEDEKRFGLRAALRLLSSACTQCKQVPTSLSPSDCPVCGSFKLGRF
jgi:mobilome CxxCx(11)CxxC protein